MVQSLYYGQYHVQQCFFSCALDRSIAQQHDSNAPGVFPTRFVALVSFVSFVSLVSLVSVVSQCYLLYQNGRFSRGVSYARNGLLIWHQEGAATLLKNCSSHQQCMTA